MVKFYTKENCPKCAFSKQMLGQRGINFEEINIDHNEEAKQSLLEKGFQSLPVIDFGTEVVVGNDPAKLMKVIATV